MEKKNLEICREIGKAIARMHEADLIHGDLTTSNILLEGGKLYFIDFGLGFYSKKIEDKAVDLLVFKKTYEATHCNLPEGWGMILEGYLKEYGAAGKAIAGQIEKIEQRARYH